MKFSSPTYKSIPIPTTTAKQTLPISGRGDTWYMSVVQTYPEEIDWGVYVAPRGIPSQIYVEKINKISSGTVVEGQDLVVRVFTREVSLADITGTYTILASEDGVEDLDTSVTDTILKETVSEYDNTVEYDRLLIQQGNQADISSPLVGTYTILAGESFVDITINTVDDTVYTGGDNTYRYFRLELTEDSTLLTVEQDIVLLLEDGYGNIPVAGALELSLRVDKDFPEEALLSPLTGLTEVLSLTTTVSVILDKTPLYMLYVAPRDIAPISELHDLNGYPAYYQVVVKAMES